MKRLLVNIVLVYGLAVSLTLAPAALLMPILYGLGFFYSGDIINSFLGGFCHQRPSRSFMLFGYPFGLCIRCFAIYSSFSSFSAYFLSKGKSNIPAPLIGMAAAAWMPAELTVRYFTGLDGDNALRLVTGALFGIGSAVLIMNLRKDNPKKTNL